MFNNNTPSGKSGGGPINNPGESLSPGKEKSSSSSMTHNNNNMDSPSKQQQQPQLIQAPALDSNDTKVLIESDKLQKDLKTFLESLTQKQSVFSKMIVGSKRSAVEQAYESLVKRIEISETGLRKIYTDSKVHDNALTTQACQLYLKVNACLKFSVDAIPARKRDGEMLAGLLTDIIAWIQYLWTMVRFQQEIIHQEQTQALFLPEMMSDPAPRMASLPGEREDDIIMIQKLRKLKKVGIDL